MKTTIFTVLTFLMIQCYSQPTLKKLVAEYDSLILINENLKKEYSWCQRSYLSALSIIDSLIKLPADTVIVNDCDTVIPPIEPINEVNIVWSENFDAATKPQAWPYFSKGWFDDRNTLQNVTGRGKVLQVYHGQGNVGSSSGIGNYRIPLDKGYKELFLSWDVYVPADFDLFKGGKFFGGLAGGSSTAIPNNDKTDTDGWVSMFLFNQNGNYSTYNYFKGALYNSSGWPYGTHVANITKGQWQNITIRLRVNDGDKANGLLEVFNNKVLVYQQVDAKVVNGFNPNYLIEQVYLNNFFGGGDKSFASPIKQWMQFDNIVAFYYPKGSKEYRSGASERNRIITVPTAISYHPTPPNRFIEKVYTEKSGTILSHEGFEIPVQNTSFQTSTIYVPNVSSITLNVTQFKYDGGITYLGYKQIIRIYKGTGSNKTLLRTFMNGTYTTVPTTIAITGNSATIEWQNGSGNGGQWTINYTSK
jgi:hypothetical protein